MKIKMHQTETRSQLHVEFFQREDCSSLLWLGCSNSSIPTSVLRSLDNSASAHVTYAAITKGPKILGEKGQREREHLHGHERCLSPRRADIFSRGIVSPLPSIYGQR